MFEIRTDLAEELRSHVMASDAKSSAGEIDGVLYRETEKGDVRISTIDIINENGEKKQRWETFKTYAEAHKRRAEIEYKQTEGTFLPPNKQTVADVLKDYVALYGEKTWSYSTFNSNCSMIANYIVSIIGNKENERDYAEGSGQVYQDTAKDSAR